MKKHGSLTVLLLIIPLLEAYSYETPVHKLITTHAFERLRFGFLAKLGVAPDRQVAGRPLLEWMEIGSIEEDDGARALNHFFNPVDLAPLTIGKFPSCAPAPFSNRADLWAVGEVSRNDYSIADAKDYYEEAVMGRDPEARDLALKELFLTLGHVVHLIQDMGQPEHARNDIHLKVNNFVDLIVRTIVGERMPSMYEAWALANVTAGPSLIDFDGYPTVRLPDYLSYFHTADSRGTADFSNRNYLTQDTNYGDYTFSFEQPCFQFDEPAKRNATLRTFAPVSERVLRPDGACCITRVVDESILKSPVTDRYMGISDEDLFHTFVSALDLETRKYDPSAQFYSLGDSSYSSRASMLIPRAVGYSAGVIEHLFRGEIDAAWKRNANGGYDLTITNKSSEAIGSDATIRASYRATPAYFESSIFDTGRIVPETAMTSLVAGFSGLQPGASVTFPVVPLAALQPGDNLLSFERRIVVDGTLGNERHAVIGLVQPAQVTPRVTWGFGAWLPPLQQPPYFHVANVASGLEYGAMNGALAYGSPFLNRLSPLYMSAYAGGKVTFWWGYQIKKPSFLLVNGENPMNFSIVISPSKLFDGQLFQIVSLQAYEERVIELPTGIARFSVLPGLGYFAIDDVGWE